MEKYGSRVKSPIAGYQQNNPRTMQRHRFHKNNETIKTLTNLVIMSLLIQRKFAWNSNVKPELDFFHLQKIKTRVVLRQDQDGSRVVARLNKSRKAIKQAGEEDLQNADLQMNIGWLMPSKRRSPMIYSGWRFILLSVQPTNQPGSKLICSRSMSLPWSVLVKRLQN